MEGEVGGIAPKGNQALLVIVGNPTKDYDITDNILEIENHMVFLAAK